MKILRVEIEGFGPFPGKEVIDFESFAGDGKFLITGRTGAGKSSILDAITFALFGHVPRYGSVGADPTVRSDFLQDSEVATEVSVEFATDTGRYRVTRRPSYSVPNRKTALPQHAEIAQWKSEGWEVLASRKVKEVAAHISTIVGLSAEQFQQVILLAQGQFQEFLVADSNERRKLLRRLFDTGRFLDYSDDLDARAARLAQDLELVNQAVRTNIDNLANTVDEQPPADLDPGNSTAVRAWADPLLEAQKVRLAQADAEVQEKEKLANHARGALEQARRIAADQQRLAEATASHARLQAAAPAIEAEHARLILARNADRSWPAVQAHTQAIAAEASAAKALASAQQSFRQRHKGADESISALDSSADRLVGEIARLQDAAAQEAQIPALRLAEEQATNAAVELEKHIAALREERSRLQEKGRELDVQLEPLILAATQQPAAEAKVETLKARLESAEKAEATQQSLAAAQEVADKAQKDLATAEEKHHELQTKQLSDYAATLAQALTDGEPCAVCGSRDHPAVASATGEEVSSEAIDRAAQGVVAARRQHQTAENEVANLKGLLSGQVQAAQASSVESLARELAEAQKALSETQAAVAQKQTLAHQKEQGHQRVIELGAEIEKTQTEQAGKAAEAAGARQKLAAAESAVSLARGTTASVAARVEELKEDLQVVRDLHAALKAHQSADAELVTRGAELSASLDNSGFATAEQVLTARIPLEQQEQIDQAIDRHNRALAVAQATLNDENLKGLPEEPVDTTAAENANKIAEEEHRLAIGRQGQVQRQCAQVRQLRSEIVKKLDEAGDAQREYDIVNRLARTVRGQSPNTQKMTLETFALAADLEDIVTAANVLLAKMTANRYELRHSDELAKGGAQSGLAIEVIDAYNGEARAPTSLSGGEKFQASLALALGLAEVVTSRNGGLNLDTLFIDEGFGTLDPDTLETTLDTVDSLREGGRMVGLISHVAEVKERIPHHINVKVTDEGWSTLGTVVGEEN